MGAKRNINVTGANKNTAAQTLGSTLSVSHFKVMSAASAGTAKTNWIALSNGTQAIPAGGMLNIADAGIAVTMGNAGTSNKFPDAAYQEKLDKTAGTYDLAAGDYIAWSTDGSTETTYLARTSVDAWDASITY